PLCGEAMCEAMYAGRVDRSGVLAVEKGLGHATPLVVVLARSHGRLAVRAEINQSPDQALRLAGEVATRADAGQNDRLALTREPHPSEQAVLAPGQAEVEASVGPLPGPAAALVDQ